jgi:hypothetical protein
MGSNNKSYASQSLFNGASGIKFGEDVIIQSPGDAEDVIMESFNDTKNLSFNRTTMTVTGGVDYSDSAHPESLPMQHFCRTQRMESKKSLYQFNAGIAKSRAQTNSSTSRNIPRIKSKTLLKPFPDFPLKIELTCDTIVIESLPSKMSKSQVIFEGASRVQFDNDRIFQNGKGSDLPLEGFNHAKRLDFKDSKLEVEGKVGQDYSQAHPPTTSPSHFKKSKDVKAEGSQFVINQDRQR